MAKHLRPKGARGMAQVRRLGRNYKTGNFAKIQASAEKRGLSKEAAQREAGAVFQNAARKYMHG